MPRPKHVTRLFPAAARRAFAAHHHQTSRITTTHDNHLPSSRRASNQLSSTSIASYELYPRQLGRRNPASVHGCPLEIFTIQPQHHADSSLASQIAHHERPLSPPLLKDRFPRPHGRSWHHGPPRAFSTHPDSTQEDGNWLAANGTLIRRSHLPKAKGGQTQRRIGLTYITDCSQVRHASTDPLLLRQRDDSGFHPPAISHLHFLEIHPPCSRPPVRCAAVYQQVVSASCGLDDYRM